MRPNRPANGAHGTRLTVPTLARLTVSTAPGKIFPLCPANYSYAARKNVSRTVHPALRRCRGRLPQKISPKNQKNFQNALDVLP